jgi:ribonuclease HI
MHNNFRLLNVVLGIESWLTKWRANNFRTASNKPVSNQSLIMYLDALLCAKAPGTVKLVHVQAHVGLEGNEAADTLAGLGCTKPWREEYPGEWDVSKVEGRDDNEPSKIDIQVS